MVLIKIVFAVDLKHSSFRYPADGKHKSDDLCMKCKGSACLLSVYTMVLFTDKQLSGTKKQGITLDHGPES